MEKILLLDETRIEANPKSCWSNRTSPWEGCRFISFAEAPRCLRYRKSLTFSRGDGSLVRLPECLAAEELATQFLRFLQAEKEKAAAKKPA